MKPLSPELRAFSCASIFTNASQLSAETSARCTMVKTKTPSSEAWTARKVQYLMILKNKKSAERI